jgi:hypothetical protein
MAAKKAGKRTRAKAQRDEEVYFVVEITDWEWSFSFGVGWRRDIDREPYSDYRHLHIKGRLLRPSKIKAQEAELIFMPEAELNWSERANHQPQSVGLTQIYRGMFKPLLRMPGDSVAPVLQMLIAEKFKYVVLNGDKPRYGQGAIRSYRFEMKMEEDDLPPED